MSTPSEESAKKPWSGQPGSWRNAADKDRTLSPTAHPLDGQVDAREAAQMLLTAEKVAQKPQPAEFHHISDNGTTIPYIDKSAQQFSNQIDQHILDTKAVADQIDIATRPKLQHETPLDIKKNYDFLSEVFWLLKNLRGEGRANMLDKAMQLCFPKTNGAPTMNLLFVPFEFKTKDYQEETSFFVIGLGGKIVMAYYPDETSPTGNQFIDLTNAFIDFLKEPKQPADIRNFFLDQVAKVKQRIIDFTNR